MLYELMQQVEAGNVDAFLPLVDELVEAGMCDDATAAELVDLAYVIMGDPDMQMVMAAISVYQELLAKIKRGVPK